MFRKRYIVHFNKRAPRRRPFAQYPVIGKFYTLRGAKALIRIAAEKHWNCEPQELSDYYFKHPYSPADRVDAVIRVKR